MGGLKKELPITYWTFLIGALAIAGVRGLAGFFSKDEILFRTYASGHTLLWVDRPADVAADRGLHVPARVPGVPRRPSHGAQRPQHLAPEHLAPGTRHRAPGTTAPHAPAHICTTRRPPMAIALIVLAVGSVVAGYVGLPHVLGGSTGSSSSSSRALRRRAARRSGAPPRRRERSKLDADGGVDARGASAGIGIAVFFFLKNRERGRRVSPSGSPACTACCTNKYYVDEIYDAAIVQPIRIVSEEGLWKGVDVQRDRRRGQRRRRDRSAASSERAAPAADRVGARLRRVAVSRRGDDARLLPVAITLAIETRSDAAFRSSTSLIALPIAGALAAAVRRSDDEQNAGAGPRRSRWSCRCWCSPRRCCCGPVRPGVGRLPVRRAPRLDSGVRHQLLRRRRRHQPAAAGAHRLPDAARAAQLVGVGAQEDRARSASSCCCSRAR